MSNHTSSHVDGRAGVLPRLVSRGPHLILMVFLAACIAVTIALTVRQFTPWLVIPLCVVAVAALARFVPDPPSAGWAELICAPVAILGAAAWALLNVPYAAQLLLVGRDPAIYTLTGVWLGKHHSAEIDGRHMLALQHLVHGSHATLDPFLPDGSGMMHGQGGVTLPGILGIGGWIDGVDGVLKMNLVVGAVALIGIYAFARQFVRPWLALVPEAALALAVPFMYLMRATYSESIMLVAALAAFVWLVAAVRTSRIGLAVVGGVLLGVTAMARIDGPVALLGSAALVSVIALIVRREELRSFRRIGLAFLAAAFVSSALGLLSLVVDQRRYLGDLRGQATMLWGGSVALLVVCVVIFWARRRGDRGERTGGLQDATLGRLGTILGIVVPVVFAILWSRPAWWHGHFIQAGSVYAKAIESWQRQTGQPVDGTRSYDELTLHWVAWYFGGALVVLAAIGLGLMLRRAIADRRADLLVVVVPTAVVGMLYLNKVSITPDQIWAYRRLLPIITPGLLLGAVWVVEWWLRRPAAMWLRFVPAAVAVVLLVGGPVLAWNHLTDEPENAGDRAFTSALCRQLGRGTVVVAEGQAPPTIELTVKVVCGNDVLLAPASDRADLRTLAAHLDGRQIIAFAPQDLPGDAHLGKPNITGDVRTWRHTLVSAPSGTDDEPLSVWVGHIDGGSFVQDPSR